MRDPIYLTHADRSLRSDEWKQLYCYALRVLIRGHWYVRWFVTREDRAEYAKQIKPIAEVISKGMKPGSQF